MAFKWTALKIAIVCIAVFLVQLFVNGFTELFVLNSSAWHQPWRFVTAIFLHADVLHILYNMFALILFGSILERYIGGRRFLIVFFVTGILANVIAVNFYPSSLGASGAIFGIIGALIVVRPLLVVWAFGLPMPMFVAGIVWAIGDIIGVFVPSNVGNIAHLSGMALGLLFGVIYRDWSRRRGSREKVKLDEGYVRSWEDYYLK